ncbi:MAG TPA: hypothetical protein VHO70_19855 [Chitinispirillaceae bacterium]|nr:hypothetical protein [Chitinispirillaceae bacterium]
MDFSGGQYFIFGILLAVWLLLMIVMPWFVIKIHDHVRDMKNSIVGLRKDVSIIRDQLTKKQLKVVVEKEDVTFPNVEA